MPENLPHRAPSATPMQAVEWGGELPDRLRAALPGLQLRFLTYLNQNFLEADAGAITVLLEHLQSAEGFDMLTDLTAVDYPHDEKRFEMIYLLYGFGHNTRIRVKVRAGLDEAVPSVTAIHPAANWLEREVFDMFGIRFSGHPDLKRILMPDDWNGFPLRKDKTIIDMDQDWVQRNLGIESGQS
jgi:NADH-quinone oxidoreductase subunit C